jgi:hypothetical protein
MPEIKPASKGKRSKKAFSVLSVAGLGAAGLSLALPANGSVAASLPPSTAVTPLAEEEISDVTLATFHVYDKENAGVNRSPLLQLTRCGCGGRGCGGRGCRGCGGRGCRCGGHGCRCRGGCGCGGCGCGVGGCCLSWGGCRPWC